MTDLPGRATVDTMKNVQVDADGELVCWNCGGRSFTEKRTTRSKLLVGVGALATKKKLKCRACGKYNDVGSAEPVGGVKAAKAEAAQADGWVKVKARDLQPGDVIKQMGLTSTVESVEQGRMGLKIHTDAGSLRAFTPEFEFTVRRAG